MTLQELRYLVALADKRHFVSAAQACHVGQLTLSMQLKKLENQLGRMGQYLARFDPRFIGAVGSRPILQKLADDLSVAPPGLENEASSGSIWVIGPDAIRRTELLPPFDVLPLTAEFMRTRARR